MRDSHAVAKAKNTDRRNENVRQSGRQIERPTLCYECQCKLYANDVSLLRAAVVIPSTHRVKGYNNFVSNRKLMKRAEGGATQNIYS